MAAQARNSLAQPQLRAAYSSLRLQPRVLRSRSGNGIWRGQDSGVSKVENVQNVHILPRTLCRLEAPEYLRLQTASRGLVKANIQMILNPTWSRPLQCWENVRMYLTLERYLPHSDLKR
jgi:hypothetical protein